MVDNSVPHLFIAQAEREGWKGTYYFEERVDQLMEVRKGEPDDDGPDSGPEPEPDEPDRAR